MTSDLEQEIAETREHLGETVDALAAKLDVKSRAKDADKRPLVAIGVLIGGLVAAKALWPSKK
jgi:chemotaxis response regulator CheB